MEELIKAKLTFKGWTLFQKRVQEIELCQGTEVKLFGLNSVLSVGTQVGLFNTLLVPWSKPKSFSLETQSG